MSSVTRPTMPYHRMPNLARDDLRRLAFCVAHMTRPQDLVQDDRAERSKREIVELEVTELDVGAARGEDQRHGSHRQVGSLGEIDPAVHPDLGADHSDEAEEIELDPADHAARNAVDQRAELGDEAEEDGRNGRDDKNPDREDACHAHDADVLGVRGFASAAEECADNGSDAVAHERPAEISGQVALHDPADREDVARVLRDEDQGDEPEEAELTDGIAEAWK